MTRLPTPLREALRDPLDEAAVQRMWRGVERRRARVARAPRRQWAAGLAVAAAVLFALAAGATRRGSLLGDPGPLRREGGAEVTVLDRARTAPSPRPEALSDGSRITLAPGTRLEALENNGRSFMVLLVGGAADFEVRPGGPRRWTVECGAAAVEVVGTGFRVERRPERVRVDVRHGVVLVRGERVPDRVRRLTDGQWIVLDLATPPPALAARRGPADARPDAAAASAPPPPAPAAPAARTARDAWRELARRGRFADAYRALGPAGLQREAHGATADDLLRLADVARLSGHPEGAVGPLTELLARHRGDPTASLAAFTLGRVELDGLGRPSRAAAAFAQAIDLGAPRGLLEDAHARLVEARARAGDLAGARAAADAYHRRFPDGRRAAAVRRWVE